MGWKNKLKQEYRKEMDAPKDDAALSKYLGIESGPKPKKYHNPTRRAIAVVATVATVVVIGGPVGIFFLTHLQVHTRGEVKAKRYRKADVAGIASSTIEALNVISYEDHDAKVEAVDETFASNVNSFAYALHQQFTEKGNYLYSPYTAYLNLDLASLASKGSVALDAATYLGSLENRNLNIPNAIATNFFTGDNGAVHTYQGAFFQKGLQFQDGYIDKLTSRRAESYRLDMNAALDKIPAWANARVNANLLKTSDLEYDPDSTIAYYLSILDFDGKWASIYNESKTKADTFTRLDGTTKTVDFMDHTISYVSAKNKQVNRKDVGVYDYGDYVSAYDYYKNGYSIQYLTPKQSNGDIFALLEGKNFFEEDPAKEVDTTLGTEDHYDDISMVEIILPKFSYSSFYDLTPKIKGLGFSSLYTNLQDSLGGGIELSPNGGALSFTKQANSIEFTENGTIAKSITFSAGYGASAPAYITAGTYVITLDEAFVYVIRDPNGLPLFVGAYNG